MTGIDEAIRLRAFEWLKEQAAVHGDVLPRPLLEKGFEFEGERIPLLAPQGIFKPRHLNLPLSITTAPKGPYADSFSQDGYLLYKYRGTNPFHRDNLGLRQAMAQGTPLVYFHGLVPGRYLATWPVYIVGDDPAALTFKVAVDDAAMGLMGDQTVVSAADDVRRAYITTIVRQRLHQRSFRERVLRAYREQCALCQLRHYELLDAAHIIPDTEPEGLPSVRNGISLCRFHHAAFDALLLGITPDYTVEIRIDVLKEKDGPMLQHGLKELHEARIVLPRDKRSWPDQQALDLRYRRFRLAS
ncbi:MAG: HNH endonuclease [Syntrophorhabdales bacterium]|jgi:putative restriction endonuclease